MSVISAGLIFAGYQLKQSDSYKNGRLSDSILIANQKIVEMKIDKETFSIDLPAGWEEAKEAAGTSTAIAVNQAEIINDPIAKQKNFRSYFSIVGGETEEQNVAKQAKEFKKNFSGLITGVIFSEEKSREINGKDAYFMESKFTQQGIDLRVLIIFIKGKDQEMWRLSFNSIESQWEKNREVFYQVADSFIAKN